MGVGGTSMDDIDNVGTEKLRELKSVFATFDNDQSGSISANEFRYALTKMGIYLTKEDIDELFFEVDQDGDQNLDFEEFIKLVAILDPRVSQEIEINKAFKLYDKNQDGYISRSEVEEGLKRFGITSSEEDIDFMFSITDDDNDGLITQTEFKNLLYDAGPPDKGAGFKGQIENASAAVNSGSQNFTPSRRVAANKYIRTTYTPGIT